MNKSEQWVLVICILAVVFPMLEHHEIGDLKKESSERIVAQLRSLFYGFGLIQKEFSEENRLPHSSQESLHDSMTRNLEELTSFKATLNSAEYILQKHLQADPINPDLVADGAFKAILASYDTILLGQGEFIDLDKKVLNDPSWFLKNQQAVLSEMDSNTNVAQNGWQGVEMMAIGLRTDLIDLDRSIDGHNCFLKITASQREKLREELIDDFGKDVKTQKKQEDTPVMEVAKIWWQSLSDPQWSTLDSSDIAGRLRYYWYAAIDKKSL